MKTKSKAKPKLKPVRIPAKAKPFVIRKFRSKDRSKKFAVARLPKDAGYVVWSVNKKGRVTPMRTFEVPPPSQTQIPTPVIRSVLADLAIFWARYVARNGTPPSERRERGRRRRLIKKALEKYQAHLTTKLIVDQLKGRNKPTVRTRKPLTMRLPYICIYDPKQSLGDTTFRIHTAYCQRLDFERKRAVLKKDGASWIIEASRPEDAVALQLAEFNEGGYEYEPMDFEIHKCQGER